MKEFLGDKARLVHILDALNNIESYIEDLSFNDFMNSKIHMAAVTKELQVIGEAGNKLSEKLKSDFPEIEWGRIKGLRNILVHEYFAIDYSIIWDTIKYNIPELKQEIDKILKQIN